MSFRKDGRRNDEIREIKIIPNYVDKPDGSVLCCFGKTRVICSAIIQDGVPAWMKYQNISGGWITAEYSMLPYSTSPRKPRDSSRGKIDGRSSEIQRLIGRSLRAVIDLQALGQRTLWIDCDVLDADGGTRTAAITGAITAVGIALTRCVNKGVFMQNPLKSLAAAVSIGIWKGQPVLDLNYLEDSSAETDLNLVMDANSQFIEIQGSGEENTFSNDQMVSMLELGKKAISDIIPIQKKIISEQNKIEG